MLDSRDVVFVCKPNSWKEDCGWKCASELEATRLAKWLETFVVWDVVLMSEASWKELPENNFD